MTPRHDLAVVDLLANRIAVHHRGEPGEEDLSAPKHAYTQCLLASLPVPDPEAQAERRELLRRITRAERDA